MSERGEGSCIGLRRTELGAHKEPTGRLALAPVAAPMARSESRRASEQANGPARLADLSSPAGGEGRGEWKAARRDSKSHTRLKLERPFQLRA